MVRYGLHPLAGTVRVLAGVVAAAAVGAAALPRAPRGPAWPLAARCPAAPPMAVGGTLLDEVGRLAGGASAGETAAWRRELHAGVVPAGRAAWLHLWLGEVALGQEQAPEQALWQFRMAERVSGGLNTKDTKDTKGGEEARPRGDREGRGGEALAGKGAQCRGLAEYDAALARYYEGAYAESAAAFRHLLVIRPAAVGFERRRAALWYRHAAACAGYHAERAKAGIPEPSRLDPQCGAAGLAVCLRGLSLPYERARVEAACRPTGEGNSLQELIAACPKLGLSGRAVTADEAGLKALPKPLVAYVEHDHFIAVVRADARGVSYVCSDCGAWPGGQVDLTWAQWRALEPGLYLAVSKAGSGTDRLLSELPAAPGSGPSAEPPGPARPLQIAAAGSLSRLHLWALERNQSLLALLKGHAFAFLTPTGVTCGSKPEALACPPTISCPMDGPGGGSAPLGGGTATGGGAGLAGTGSGGVADGGAAGGRSGPLGADPVNLATGEEEYGPGADLVVYNPNGPSVAWSRSYRSMRGPDQSAEYDDLGVGWTQPYTGMVVDSNYTENTQVPAGGVAAVPISGGDAPANGATWDVLFNGTVIASSASPGGWTINDGSTIEVIAPAGATSGIGYEARVMNASPGVYHSGFFDVEPALTSPQGTYYTVGQVGSDAPGAGLVWDVLLNGTTLGSSAGPNGWSASYDASYGRITVLIPLSASITTNYEVRINGPGGNHSAFFSVIASRFSLKTGTKYLQFPNGSRISFTAPAVPTASQPSVTCTAAAGAPFMVTWNYDSGDADGHYAITFADNSQWVTTPASKWFNPGTGLSTTLCYQLAQIVDRMGHAINLNYGAAGPSGFPLLSTITDATSGQALLTFTRANDGTGNLTAVSDPYGRSVYYQDMNIKCTGVPSGFPQSYQEVKQVSQIVPTGTVGPPVRYTYGYGNVANGDGAETVPFLETITVPSPTGVPNTTSTGTINYSANTDFVASLVDANGNKRSYAAVSGTQTQVTVQNPQAVTVYTAVISYDAGMHPTLATDGSGTRTLYRLAYADPNDTDRPSSLLDGDSGDPTTVTTSMTWDQYGHLTSVTPPSGTKIVYTWSYSVFPLGRLMQVQEGTKTPTTLAYFEPSGLVQAIHTPTPGTSGSGTTVATTFTYDSLGNPLTVVRPGNNAASTITSTLNYTNDPGDLSHGIQPYSQAAAIGQPLTATDNLGNVSHLRWSRQGRLITALDALGNGGTTTYNIAGQPVLVAEPHTGQTGPGCAATAFYYLYTGGPLMTTKRFDEKGMLVRQVMLAYGSEGELLSRTGDAEAVTQAYDAAYRLVSIADGKSQPTLYAYNQAGYLASVTYPGADGVHHDVLQFPMYDAHGRNLQRILPSGTVINQVFGSAAGLLSDIQYPATPSLNVHITYDSYSRPATVADGTGSASLQYDDNNAPTSVATTYTGLPARTIGYTYWPDGSRATLTTPAGSFAYNYDAGARLVSLTNPSMEVSTWTYMPNNWLATQQLTAPAMPQPFVVATTTYTRNAAGALTDLTTQGNGGGALSEFGGLTYDGAWNPLSVTATIPAAPGLAGLTSYLYNNLSELTQEHSTRNGIYTENFGYDAAGNATTWKGATQTFNQNNQNTAWPFDANGNPTTYKGAALAFDPESRLTAYGSALTAAYNAFGQRAWKQGSAGRTYFLYDGATPVIEMDGNGTVTAVNSFGPNGLLSRHASGASTFYTFDPQGSVVQRLNSTGAVLDTHAFDAYGAELSTPASGDPWGYEAQAGYYTDRETGLQLLSQRYYDPSQGQFLTRDPLGYGGGMDLYAYCGNSPTSQIDPMGLGPQPGQDWGKNVVEFLAGVGYGMSFGTIRSAWHAEDVEDVIDYNSPFFKSGTALGMTHTVLTAAVTGGAALSFLRARLVALVAAGATATAGSQVVQDAEEEAPPANAPPDLANLSDKIVRQSVKRGWTPEQIQEAFERGERFPALNRLGGANTPATGYIHPETGQFVVIDNASGEVIQVGAPGYIPQVYGG